MKIAVALVLCSTLAVGLASVLREVQPKYSEVCYDHYGCFTTENPWTSWIRPLAGLPQPSWAVGTRFLLFTRSNQYEDYELVPDNDVILADSPYDKTKPTVFLIHGFTDSHLTDWMVKTRNALLEKEDMNVISVDWSPGASRTYLRAVNNARMVGAQLVRLLNFLVAKTELDLGSVRIVAHSVGAHAASYAGYEFWGAIGHITALDPSDPYFGGADGLVHIEKTDAHHVQVIHTNGEILVGMGMRTNIGHVDIYLNGGNSQPGCTDLLGSLIGSIVNLIGWEFDEPFAPFVCSHVRATDYYVESIKSSCPFVAHKCDSHEDYNDGVCSSACNVPGNCVALGYSSEDYSSARGVFHLNTDSEKSFCLQAVQFDTAVMFNQKTTNGKVTVEFSYGGELSKEFTIVNGKLSGGQILSKWIDVPSRVLENTTDKPTLFLRYDRDLFNERYLALDGITINIINEKMQLEQVHYPAVTLDTGKDASLSPL